MVRSAFAIRRATAADADAIAALHATSWANTYRGILLDSYIDGPMGPERLALWRERLKVPTDDLIVLVATEGKALAGFVCGLMGHGAPPCTYIDNLHVRPALHGKGLGRRLLLEAALAIPPAQSARPVALTVFTANTRASRLYAGIGGRVEAELFQVEADGCRRPTLRYVWDNVQALVRGLETVRGQTP
jgi:ribosomal protein S18 acetylase RimI-like enzyme